MKFTKEQEERIEVALSSAYGRVSTVIDGRNVTFEVRQGKGLQYLIMPFVDGKFSGRWLSATSEDFGSRLMRRSSRRVCPKKVIEKIRKSDKKRAKELDELNESRGFFSSPRQLVAHLAREFESVDVE